MSTHIGANPGDIADGILLPGDPLRARFIAETFLTDARCYNEVRGMYGYTGFYKGKRVSVQGTGMGMPSASIYIHELIREYGVKKLIRVGTCGALSEQVHVRDTILVNGCCTDSALNAMRFGGLTYAATASFDLLRAAWEAAQSRGIAVKVGNVYATDLFYNDKTMETAALLAQYGVLAVEMESWELFTVAARHGAQALTVLTVSDELVTGVQTTAAERQTTFRDMIELALEVI